MKELNLQELNQVAGGDSVQINVGLQLPLSYIPLIVDQIDAMDNNKTDLTQLDPKQIMQYLANAGINPDNVLVNFNMAYSATV